MKRALLSLALTAACHGGPTIDSFTVDKNSINSGDEVSFAWKVSGATKLAIDPDVGDVSGKTSVQAHPFATSAYTLTATGGSGTSKAKVNITVKPPAGTATFVATPAQIAPGEPVTLSWSIADASSVEITGFSGSSLAATGSVTVSGLQQNTRYSLTAAQLPAPIVALVRVTAPPAITSFNVPQAAQQGSDVALSWTATNVTSFTLKSDDGLSQFLGPLTSFTVQPNKTTTYILFADGPTGHVSRKATLTVGATPGQSFIYTNPPTGNEVVQLVTDPANPCGQPCTQLTLELIVMQSIAADALAIDLPIPGASRASLHLISGVPDWQVNPDGNALDPGLTPRAAAIALPTSGPLARVLTLGIAQKPAGNGAQTTPKQLAPTAVLARFKLDLIPGGGTGLVFSPAQAPAFVIRAAGVPQGSLAIGTLRVQ